MLVSDMAVPHYPIRSFIKFSVTAQLTADLTGQPLATYIDRPGTTPEMNAIVPDPDERYRPLVNTDTPVAIDEHLLGEIIQNALLPEHHPELYQAYPTQHLARQVEQGVIADIINAYKHIKLNQQHSQVQELNALL